MMLKNKMHELEHKTKCDGRRARAHTLSGGDPEGYASANEQHLDVDLTMPIVFPKTKKKNKQEGAKLRVASPAASLPHK